MKDGATRDAYGEALIAIGDHPRLVVLDAGVSDSTRTKKFGDKFPHRFFNMGISEADMVCTAAGFATTGNKTAFATSFSAFLLGRSMDQILVSVAYSNTNVKLVGTHCGLAVGEDGPTAQMIVDLAYTRALPNMTVVQPADWEEAFQATKALFEHQGPAYLRLGRSSVKAIYDANYKFQIGKASVVKQGGDAVIFATGIMVQESLKAMDILKAEGINVGLVNVSSLKPIDAQTICEQAKSAKAVITAEDHNRIGGLGDAVLDVLAQGGIHRAFRKVAVNDQFAETGDPQSLFEKYGLSAPHIVAAVKTTLHSAK
jgi:transketolase